MNNSVVHVTLASSILSDPRDCSSPGGAVGGGGRVLSNRMPCIDNASTSVSLHIGTAAATHVVYHERPPVARRTPPVRPMRETARMAEMHPSTYQGKPQSGEERVFDRLRDGLKPDADWVVAHEPAIDGHSPDFVVYGRKLGIVVLEVKDWSLSTVAPGSTGRTWLIEERGEPKSRTAPNRQAAGYMYAVKERIEGIPELTWPTGEYVGKSRVPLASLVVFVNIRRADFVKSDVADVLSADGALFAEDLDLLTGVFNAATPSRFEALVRSRKMLPFQLGPMTPAQDAAIVDVVAPVVRRSWRSASGPRTHDRLRWEMTRLDREQARISFRLGRGHHILRGPPGSGKTLVLLHRAVVTAKRTTSRSRVLLLCFNLALASQLKRLVLEQRIGVGPQGVEVYSFNDFVAHVLGERVDHAGQNKDYYEGVHRRALAALSAGASKVAQYDTVLVDEGQDFSTEMLRIVLGHLKPDGNLLIALDPGQALYARVAAWSDAGVNAVGRTHTLSRRYRGTRQITHLAHRLAGTPTDEIAEPELFAENPNFDGPAPDVRVEPGDAARTFVTADIAARVTDGEYEPREIAVHYDDKIRLKDDFVYGASHLPEQIVAELAAAGIAARWISEDVRAKQLYDPTTDSVAVISVHSAKGLEWDLVYLLGIENLPWTGNEVKQSVSALQVAVTRACHRLIVVAGKDSPVVGILRAAIAPG
ncbi:MAG: hypothetical protein HMLKMBBP_03121 [Planctomycetes bacterium]|nr:hypothetical protein [Planctomycetota bacterium]